MIFSQLLTRSFSSVRRHRVVARAVEVLSLEARNHFSVTAAQLAGPLTDGAVYTYDVTAGISGPQTITIKRPSTFNGAPAIEEDIAGPGTGSLSTSSSFYSPDLSGGFQFLGTTQADVTFTNTAGAFMFPANLTANQPVTANYTQTSTDFSADIQTSTTLENDVAVTRMVGGKSYNVYIVDQTLTEFFDAETSATTTYKYFIDPTVGTVESDTTDGGGNVTIAQLTSVTGLDTGGSGGGNTLTATITSSSLPATVVAGAKLNKSVSVDVANSGAAIEKTAATVTLYASADGTFDSSDILLGSTKKGLNLKAGLDAPVSVTVKTLPTSLAGAYTLIAVVTDASGTLATAVGGTLTATAATAPLVPTAGSLKTVKKGTGTFTASVENMGNVAYANTFTTTLIGAADGNAANATSIVTTPFKKKAFAINKAQKITLKLTAAQVTAYQSDTYLAVQIVDALGAIQTLVLVGAP